MKTQKNETQKNKMLQYILMGVAAVGGIFLLSSFSSGPETSGSVGKIPSPPVSPDGSNPNEQPTFGFNPGNERDYWKYLEYIGYTAGAILIIYGAYKDWKTEREIKEGKEKIVAALGPGLNWNVGFENKGFFSQPGNWGLSQGGVQWGLNSGGAFKISFNNNIGVGNFNSYLASNNFSSSSFTSLFSSNNFNFSTANLFSSNGNWNFTNSVGNWI